MTEATQAIRPGPVLVVDDDPQVRHMIQMALEAELIPVRVAARGREGLQLAAADAPSVVVLDVTLPELGSAEVAAALRASHGLDLPLIVITGDGNAAAKAARLGAYGYLRKPFELDDLIDLVRRAMVAP